MGALFVVFLITGPALPALPLHFQASPAQAAASARPPRIPFKRPHGPFDRRGSLCAPHPGTRSTLRRWVRIQWPRNRKALVVRKESNMRHALASVLFAVPICAFAAPALAQTYNNGPAGPVGSVIAAPFNFLAAPFSGWSGTSGGVAQPNSGMTIASQTGTPAYSYGSRVPPAPAPVGHCDIISGQRVCFSTP
jgi:hypothetical protein